MAARRPLLGAAGLAPRCGGRRSGPCRPRPRGGRSLPEMRPRPEPLLSPRSCRAGRSTCSIRWGGWGYFSPISPNPHVELLQKRLVQHRLVHCPCGRRWPPWRPRPGRSCPSAIGGRGAPGRAGISGRAWAAASRSLWSGRAPSRPPSTCIVLAAMRASFRRLPARASSRAPTPAPSMAERLGAARAICASTCSSRSRRAWYRSRTCRAIPCIMFRFFVGYVAASAGLCHQAQHVGLGVRKARLQKCRLVHPVAPPGQGHPAVAAHPVHHVLPGSGKCSPVPLPEPAEHGVGHALHIIQRVDGLYYVQILRPGHLGDPRGGELQGKLAKPFPERRARWTQSLHSPRRPASRPGWMRSPAPPSSWHPPNHPSGWRAARGRSPRPPRRTTYLPAGPAGWSRTLPPDTRRRGGENGNDLTCRPPSLTMMPSSVSTTEYMSMVELWFPLKSRDWEPGRSSHVAGGAGGDAAGCAHMQGGYTLAASRFPESGNARLIVVVL